MRLMAGGLMAFGYFWVSMVVFFSAIGLYGWYNEAVSFWAWWERVQAHYSPYNFGTLIFNLVALSPALGAFTLAGKLRERLPAE